MPSINIPRSSASMHATVASVAITWRSVLFLGALLFIIALRLGIWKFFPDMEFALKDEFSNMVIAASIYGVAALFFGIKLLRGEGLVRHGLEGPLALFILTVLMSMGITADHAASLRAMVILTAYVLFFWMLYELLLQEMPRQIFFWFFMAASVVIAGFGINDIIYLSRVPASEIEAARLSNESLYYILVNKRACSLFGWPNVLAGFLMLGMPLTAGLFLAVRHWALKGICAIALLSMLTAFFFTYSVLGWSVFLFTSMVMLAISWRAGLIKVPAYLKKWIYAGFVLMLVLFVFVIIRKNFQSSLAPRKEYVRVVKTVISDHPWRGCGFGAYRAASLRYVNNAAGVTGFAHNAYLQVWAECGVIGFLALLWMLVLLFKASIKAWIASRAKLMLVVVLWGLLAVLMDNLNSFTLLKPNSSFFFWTWLALGCSYLFNEPRRALGSFTIQRCLLVALILASCAGFGVSGRSASYFYWLQRGISFVNAGDNKMGRLFLDRAQPFDPMDVKVWTVRGMSYLKDFQTSQQKDDLEKAQKAFEQAASLAPNFYHSFLILGRIHAYKGNMPLAEQLQQKALLISPFEVTRDLKQLNGAGAQ